MIMVYASFPSSSSSSSSSSSFYYYYHRHHSLLSIRQDASITPPAPLPPDRVSKLIDTRSELRFRPAFPDKITNGAISRQQKEIFEASKVRGGGRGGGDDGDDDDDDDDDDNEYGRSTGRTLLRRPLSILSLPPLSPLPPPPRPPPLLLLLLILLLLLLLDESFDGGVLGSPSIINCGERIQSQADPTW